MAERKRGLYLESDAFVALPGGLGTLEELAEVLSWRQLGFHQKPIVLFDVEGYWQPILDWMRDATTKRMISAQFLNNGVYSAATVQGVCEAIEQAWSSPASIGPELHSEGYAIPEPSVQKIDNAVDGVYGKEPAADWTQTQLSPSADITR
jgi:predicted Rossmann-fold nucleotide-binding protein